MSHGSAGPCHFVELGQHQDSGFVRNIWVPVQEFASARTRMGNRGLYTSIFRFSSPSPDADEVWGPLYFDFDGDWEQVRQDVLGTLSYLRIVWRLSYDEMRLYFSGRKGCHLTVPAPVLGVHPRHDLNQVYRSIARDVVMHTAAKTLDMKIYDRRRLFRVPLSQHHVSGLYKIPILPTELARLSEEEIHAMAETPRDLRRPALSTNHQAAAVMARYEPKEEQLSSSAGQVMIEFDPPCVLALIESGAPSGQRNLACAALANHFQRRGLSEADALERLLDWNVHNAPPLPEREVRGTVRSIYRNEYSYGCTTFEMVSKCSDKCPIYAHRN